MEEHRVDTPFHDMVLLKMRGRTLLYQSSSLCPVSSLLSYAPHYFRSIDLGFAGDIRTDIFGCAFPHGWTPKPGVGPVFIYVFL